STSRRTRALHSRLPRPPPSRTHPLSLHDALPICAAAHTSPRPPARKPDQRLQRLRRHGAPREEEDRRDGRAPVRGGGMSTQTLRSEEHTSELQSPYDLVCRLLLEKKNKTTILIRR